MEVRPIEQIGCNAGRLRRSKVALLVPDHEANIDIHRVSLKQSSNHPRLRLATIAKDTVSLNQSIRVMWAELERIDMRTNDGQLTRHPFVQIANMPLLIIAPRNTRLIRYDKRKISGVIDCLYGLLGSFHPPDFVGIKSIAVVLIENAITIKENCWTLQSSLTHVRRNTADLPTITAPFQQVAVGQHHDPSLRCASCACSCLLLKRKLASFCRFDAGPPPLIPALSA